MLSVAQAQQPIIIKFSHVVSRFHFPKE